MTSEIRANTLKNRVGLGTVSFTNTGPVVSGIVTIANSTAAGVRLEDNAGVGNSLKITTPTGYVSIGAGNATFVHLNTDRGIFYFQRRITVDEGIISSYDENLVLQSPVNTTRLTINKDTGLVSIVNDLDVDGHTNLDNVSVAGVSTFSGVVRVPNGSATAPAIHFGDSDSGVYGDSSNGVRLTAGGSDTIVATTNGVTFPPQATALTSFTLGSQSALSKPLYFADSASVQSASILLDNSSQELRIKNGRFSGQITFTTYNTEKLRIASSGLIYVNRDGVGGRIDATAGDASIKFSDGNGRQTLKIATMASGQSAAHAFDANGDLNLNTSTNQYGYRLNIQDSAIIYAQTASSGGLEAKWHLDNSAQLMEFGTVTTDDLALVTNNVSRVRITSDGQLTHTANKNSDYTARFNQSHADNPAYIEINGPTDNNIRPTYIQLSQAGTKKWAIGQVYASTVDRAFHVCSGSSSESNSKIVVTSAGRVGISTNNPQGFVDVLSFDVLGSVFRRDFNGPVSDASSKLALTVWGGDHDDAVSGTGTDQFGPMIGFGARHDDYAPNTGDIRAAISYSYNGDLTFHAKSGASVASGDYERMRIDGGTGHITLKDSTVRYNNTGGGFNQVKHLEFPIYFSSTATHNVLTIGGALDSGFVCFAVLEYIGLYSYAGQEMSGGVKRAFTRRRNNNTSWRAFNDQVSENIGENRRPTLFWDNNILKVTTPSATQITGYIRVSAHANNMSNFTLTRN